MTTYQNRLTSKNDTELISRCLQGDSTAFAELMSPHKTRVKRILSTMLNDPADIDDLWQETQIRAYLKLQTLRDLSSIGSWISTIAINLARRQLKNRPLVAVSYEDSSEQVEQISAWGTVTSMSPEMRLIRQDQATEIQNAVRHLPPAEQTAIQLVYLQGFSIKEVAYHLEVQPGTIKVRLHRGRERIRQMI